MEISNSKQKIRIFAAAEIDEFSVCTTKNRNWFHILKISVTKLRHIDTDQWVDWIIASKFEERRLIYENKHIIVATMWQRPVMAVGRQFDSRT